MLNKFVAAVVIAAIVGGSSVSQAQNDFGLELEVGQLLMFCIKDVRKACVQFGMLIEQHTDKWPEWRQTHPNWFNWEKNQFP
jgi:hypothetical protein